ncbi:MAG: xanthine dehydrogenase family protein molybdopterin-binding subunit, partial [Gammaproteobacteria bacterium]|nr:xanthine dehydrogenase family protein molybdopterin-binding subunit [Gammaproteobacteria bacterium]
MQQYGIGQPVLRREDARFLVGAGKYVDDVAMEGMCHLVYVRSPHAHARIERIDTSAAAKAPGVLAVLTGEDWKADGLGSIPTRTGAKNSSGAPVPVPDRPGLCVGRARYVGDAVVAVVAETRAQAEEAAELVEVDYEPLPALVSAHAALAEGAPLIWDDLPGNVCVEFEAGDREAVTKAIAGAAHVVRLELDNQRVTAVPIEPRGVVASYDAGKDHYTVICASQNVHANRNQLCETVFKIPADHMRNLAYDVGGGFGAKNALYPEHAVVPWAAKRVGRPVKWLGTRAESFLSDSHGRDQQSEVTLALDGDGKFLALEVESVGSVGPYVLSVGPFTPTGGTARTQGGPYAIPAVYFHSRAAFTNTTPTDPYRGAGRPEASYQIERIVDLAALELGMDRAELRRKNLIPVAALPYTNGTGAEIDCGAFDKVLDRALELADWQGFAARAAESRRRGLRRGIGLAPYLECSGGGPKEHASLAFSRDGRGRPAVGSHSTGMGHETTLPQIVAATLGIDLDDIDFVQGDSHATPLGGGHGGSRSMEMGGSAVLRASERVREKAKRIAAHALEAAVVDVELADGVFRVAGTDHAITMREVIAASFDPGRRPEDVDTLDEA